MTNPSGEAMPSSIKSGTAQQPIFGAGLQENVPNISWEVSDGTLEDEVIIVDDKPKEEPEKELDQEPEEKEVEASQEEEGEEESEEPRKKYKNRIPPAKRISELTRKNKQYESLLQSTFKEKEDLQRQLALEKKAKADAEFATVKNSRDQLQYYLNQAIEEGDSAEQAKLMSQLSQYEAELRILQRENAQHANPPKQEVAPQQQYEEPEYNIPDDHPYKEVGDDWVKKNSWANPKSYDFDQEMYEDADNYSKSLMKQYKLEGKGKEIGSPEFFDEITDYIKDSYTIPTRSAPKTKAKEPMQMKNTGSNVSSVNRPAINAESTRSKQDIVLTPEQRQAAHAMAGYIKDKNGMKIYDKKQCEQIYTQNLRRIG